MTNRRLPENMFSYDPPDVEEACRNCRYFSEYIRTDLEGICRRYAPRSEMHKESNIVERPEVNAKSWCGEYARKKELLNGE